jgi:hypothetical protein
MLLLLLLLLALKIFNDFQHAMSHPGETSGAILLLDLILLQFRFRQTCNHKDIKGKKTIKHTGKNNYTRKNI